MITTLNLKITLIFKYLEFLESALMKCRIRVSERFLDLMWCVSLFVIRFVSLIVLVTAIIIFLNTL